MARRSARLVANGYYTYDEDTESYTRSICYRETPVRIFKQRRRTRQACMSVSDSISVGSVGMELPVLADLIDHEDDVACCHYEGGDSFLIRPYPKELSEGTKKDSGYSSSEGKRSKPVGITCSGDAPRPQRGVKHRNVIFCLMAVFFLLPFLPSHMIGFLAAHPDDAIPTEATSVEQSPSAEPAPVPDPVHLSPELIEVLERWLADHIKEQVVADQRRCGRPMVDRMADFALESLGATVVRSRSSETYRCQSTSWTLFGFSLRCRSQSPSVVIQGFPELLPGRCWPFQGHRGTLVVALSHPIRISHVTLDHLQSSISPTGRIDSAPKDFEIYGTVDEKDDGTLLGTFLYDKDGDPTQTFELPKPSEVHRFVTLRVLSNWGHAEYTCIYRFRVHGTMDIT